MSHRPAIPSADDMRGRPRELLQRRLEASRAETEGSLPQDLILVRIEAPVTDPEALLQRFAEHQHISWHPPQGASFAGIDVACSITAEGPQRFVQIKRAGAELWKRLRVSAGARALEAPRLFGGFAFSPTGARGDKWESFGAARFVLPRITYAVHRDSAALTLAIERSELDRGCASEHVELFQRVYEVLSANPGGLPGVEPDSVRRAEPESRAEPEAGTFEQRVDDLLGQIARGNLKKVMVARELALRFDLELDPIATLMALRGHAPDCVRFLFHFGNTSFVGATPERLLYKRARSLETEALAGTIDAGAERPEHQLRASSKELEEHRLVVSAITGALGPLCDEVVVPNQPGVRSLKHLLHLCTPIQARLSKHTHVLDLLERLHPTPAVGGVPTAAAVDWIERNEPFDRGWYSGAVGWFDAFGDGDFNVALRSGLIRSQEAWLFAGGGIVRESVSAAEYAETTLKLATLRRSLRARP